MNNEYKSVLTRRMRGAAGRRPRSQSRELSVTAFELAARLEAYEADLEVLARSGFDPARYRLLVHQLRDIGASTMALPELAAELMEITIQHFELVRLLCRPRVATASIRDEAQAQLLRQQCDSVRHVRKRCLRLIRMDPARAALPAFARE